MSEKEELITAILLAMNVADEQHWNDCGQYIGDYDEHFNILKAIVKKYTGKDYVTEELKHN